MGNDDVAARSSASAYSASMTASPRSSVRLSPAESPLPA
jgi:hypothetical protein